jgi:PAS domain-containing protein
VKQSSRDHRQLQQIIVGLTDGVILIGTDKKILWANDAALAMHGIRRIKDLVPRSASIGGGSGCAIETSVPLNAANIRSSA